MNHRTESIKAEGIIIQQLPVRRIIFIAAATLCLLPPVSSPVALLVSPPIALLIGFIIAQLVGQPFTQISHGVTTFLLQFTIAGLGFGLEVNQAMQAGKTGLWMSVISIGLTLAAGLLLGKLINVEKKTSYLIASGTAICGGSAIAAISPVVRAEKNQISVALGTIFILNAVALFVFPIIGSLLNLSQHEFGLWAAIAIHDTSSVVGAAGKYGAEALHTATTVKLIRSLFIIPMVLATAFFFRNEKYKIKFPWFMGFFVLTMILNTYVSAVHEFSHVMITVVKMSLNLTLFLIGAGLPLTALKRVGWRPLLQGILLWLGISVISLILITQLTFL